MTKGLWLLGATAEKCFGFDQTLLKQERKKTMPFKSQAQRKYLYANEPKVAKKFAEHTPKNAKLPKRVSKKK